MGCVSGCHCPRHRVPPAFDAAEEQAAREDRQTIKAVACGVATLLFLLALLGWLG